MLFFDLLAQLPPPRVGPLHPAVLVERVSLDPVADHAVDRVSSILGKKESLKNNNLLK